MSRFRVVRHVGTAAGFSWLSAVTYSTAIGNGVDSSGFASLPLRPTSAKRIYLASDGNDANNGSTHALRVATVSRAMALYTDGVGDQVLIAQGSTFTTAPPDFSFLSGGFSLLYPAVIQSYDPTDPTNEAKMGRASGSNRPVFQGQVAMLAGGQQYIAYRGLDWNPGNNSSQTHNFLDLWNGFLFENNLFRYAAVVLNIDLQQTPGRTWILRNNAFYGAFVTGGNGQSGLYLNGGWGVTVEDNVFYHCGWKIGASRDDASLGGNIYSHSAYIQHTSKAILRRNLIVEGAADGGSCRDDSVIQGNVFIDNPIHMASGGGNGTDAASPFGDALYLNANAVVGGNDINSTNPRGWGISTENGKQCSLANYNVLVHTNAATPGTAYGPIAYDGIPTYMTFDHNVSYLFSPSGGTTSASPDYTGSTANIHATYTNNKWDDPTSGSNTNVGSVSFPNSSLDVPGLCTAAGYADKTTMLQYAIDHPEQRIQRSLYPMVMNAYGMSLPSLIDLGIGMEAWRTGNVDCGCLVGFQDGTTLSLGGTWPTGFTLSNDTRFWALDGTQTAGSGTGTITENRSDGASHTTTINWTMPAAPQLSSASASTSGTTGTLHVTTDTGNGTLYWVLAEIETNFSNTRGLYPGEVKLGRTFQYNYAAAPGLRGTEWTHTGSQAVSSSGAQTITVTGLTTGKDYYFFAMQVNGSGVWSPTIDGLHAIGPVHFVP